MPEKNELFLSGKVVNAKVSHSNYREVFYEFMIEVPRLSGNVDILPIIVSEKLLYNNETQIGDYVKMTGQIRTRNKKEGQRKRLIIFGYAFEFDKITQEDFEAIEDKNKLSLEGFVVKKPVYRKTKTSRRITELLIASNRAHNKSDYLPTIAWGIDATYARKFTVGVKITMEGRFQSRDYITRGENDEPVTKTAYEVSATDIKAIEEQ